MDMYWQADLDAAHSEELNFFKGEKLKAWLVPQHVTHEPATDTWEIRVAYNTMHLELDRKKIVGLKTAKTMVMLALSHT